MSRIDEHISQLGRHIGVPTVGWGMKLHEFRIPVYFFSVRDAVSANMSGINNFVLHDKDYETDIIIMDSDADVERYHALGTIVAQNKDDIKSIREYIDPIGMIDGNGVYLEPLPTDKDTWAPIVAQNMRAIAVVNVNGARLPFYVSSGLSDKESEYGIAAGKWYPLLGVSAGWLNKMRNMNQNPYPELDSVVAMLERVYPADKIRAAALANKIPSRTSDMSRFMKITNADFPDGVNEFANPSWTYYVNENRYLPRIIRKWRDVGLAPFVNIEMLKTEEEKYADHIAGLLNMDVYSNDTGWIEFNIINQPQQSVDGIIKELGAHGIKYNSNTCMTSGRYGRRDIIGLSRDAMLETPKTTKQHFTRGSGNIVQRDIRKLSMFAQKGDKTQ